MTILCQCPAHSPRARRERGLEHGSEMSPHPLGSDCSDLGLIRHRTCLSGEEKSRTTHPCPTAKGTRKARAESRGKEPGAGPPLQEPPGSTPLPWERTHDVGVSKVQRSNLNAENESLAFCGTEQRGHSYHLLANFILISRC